MPINNNDAPAQGRDQALIVDRDRPLSIPAVDPKGEASLDRTTERAPFDRTIEKTPVDRTIERDSAAAITPVEYCGLQKAVDHFKAELFEDALPDVLITYQRAFGQAGLTKGLPDLLVLSPTLGALTGYIEQKRGRGGRLSDAQLGIGELIRERGAPYAVCRGRDEPIKVLEDWGAVRRQARAAA
jgi:hypothetical protein